MKIAFYTLGCKVNQYESNSLMEEFSKMGHSIVHHDEVADIYVINTCTVTHLADRKSRQYIKRMKKLNPESIVAAIGCYVEVSPAQVEAIDGVDIILGNKEKCSLPEIIEKMLVASLGQSSETGTGDPKGLSSQAGAGSPSDRGGPGERPRQSGLISRPGTMDLASPINDRTRAYIKIQEGCNRFCSYCIIPYARGPVESRPMDDILTEAQDLIDRGYKELVLTGINTALYGTDFVTSTGGVLDPAALSAGDSGLSIDNLVGQLNKLTGDFRIRLGSLEPNVIDWRLAEKLLKYDKLAHHMHLSLQSGSDRILKLMNRRYQMEDFEKIVKTLREADPNYGISTDIIVGFPGETEEDFRDSLQAIRDNKFVKTHAFPYSVREGTTAAKMIEQIDAKTKKARNALMIKTGEESARKFLQGMLGKDERVLVEEAVDGRLVGHTGNFIKTYIDLAANTWATHNQTAGSDGPGYGKPESKSQTSGSQAGRTVPGNLINTFLAVNIKSVYDDGVQAILK